MLPGALAILAGILCLAPVRLFARHFVEEGNGCYACHTLDARESDPKTSAIITVSRTLLLIKSYSRGVLPARLGCTYCHNSPANAAMRDALSHFGLKPSKHPVGVNFVTGTETNNEYLSTLGSSTPEDLDCVDCHDPTLLSASGETAKAEREAPAAEAEAEAEGEGTAAPEVAAEPEAAAEPEVTTPEAAAVVEDSYVNHVAPDDPRRAGNPLMLRFVTRPRQYDDLCRSCHGATAAPFKGHDLRLRAHADAAAAPIREADGTELRATAVAGNDQCTRCHDTHFSGKVMLLNDGHEGDPAIVSTDCTTICHYAGDATDSYRTRGHGRDLSTYRYRGGVVSYGPGSNYVTMGMGCISCHESLDTSDTSRTRKRHVTMNPQGAAPERYRSRFNLGLPLQPWDTGSVYGNPQAGICYSCHAATAPHRTDAGENVGCLDCHDEHAERSGRSNVFMLPLLSKKAGTYAPAARTRTGTKAVLYTTPRLDPAAGTPNTESADFSRGSDQCGICDNAECHPSFSPLADFMESRSHPGEEQPPGTDCGRCHRHNGDPAGGWRATQPPGQ